MFAATTSPWYLPTWVSGQMPDDVADRPELLARRAGARRPGRRGRPARRRRSRGRSRDPRAPAGGDEQPVAAQLAPVVELEDVARRRRAGQRSRSRTSTSSMPSPAQHLAERLAERRRLAAEHVLGHVDDRRLAAEPADRLRHLDPDRAAAQDQQAARDRLHAGRLAVGPDALELAQARDGRHDRIGAVRQHHVRRRCAARRRPRPRRARRAGRVPRSRSMPWSASQRSWPASE